MTASGVMRLLVAGSVLFVCNASAQNLLIRNATVHTAGAQGTLQNTDVLVKGGNIAAIGRGLSAAGGIEVIDAGGKPLTPTMFEIVAVGAIATQFELRIPCSLMRARSSLQSIEDDSSIST